MEEQTYLEVATPIPVEITQREPLKASPDEEREFMSPLQQVRKRIRERNEE